MDDHAIDADTGEIFQTVSESAIIAGNRARAVATATAFGIGNDQLFAAIHAALGKMSLWIKTDKANPGFKGTKYASLKAILEHVRPILWSEGVRIRQGAERSFGNDEGGGHKSRLIPVYTDLIHSESGQIERTTVEIPLAKMDAQGMGSAVSYGRRYSLLAALGLATDEADDDGETAKLNTMTVKQAESGELASLSAEMLKFRDMAKLIEWANEPKQRKQFSALGSDEQFILSHRYEDQKQKIQNGEIEAPAPAAKKGKAND